MSQLMLLHFTLHDSTFCNPSALDAVHFDYIPAASDGFVG